MQTSNPNQDLSSNLNLNPSSNPNPDTNPNMSTEIKSNTKNIQTGSEIKAPDAPLNKKSSKQKLIKILGVIIAASVAIAALLFGTFNIPFANTQNIA